MALIGSNKIQAINRWSLTRTEIPHLTSQLSLWSTLGPREGEGSSPTQCLACLRLELCVSCRFFGKDPEPRPGLSSGHIPHSFSLPFNMFLQTHTSPLTGDKYTTFLSSPDLQAALVNAVGPENAVQVMKGQRPITTSCGSGMTAGVLWLGLKLLGVDTVGLYDEVSLDQTCHTLFAHRQPLVLDWLCHKKHQQNRKGLPRESVTAKYQPLFNRHELQMPGQSNDTIQSKCSYPAMLECN